VSSEAPSGELSGAECAELLKTRNFGRVALVVDGKPEIFPVNYAFDEGVVVFRTATGLKLERGPYTLAAFEVDDIDEKQGVAWSVVAHGTAQDISSSLDTLSERLRKLAVTPIAPGERPHWMAIYSDRMTGRRFPIR
jgi:uncharacterized protein